jgi:glycosyltransferase involved in cell wall biosynthesis
MRILQIHNEYFDKGGEDTVVKLENKILKKQFIVNKLIRSNSSEIKTIFDKINVIKNLYHSELTIKILDKYLQKNIPDIVHMHNIFPLWSTSVITHLYKRNIPIVMTLHNYRFFCLNGKFYRDGKVCTKCINGDFINGIKYKCYKNSIIGSISTANYLQKIRRNDILNKINKFIVFTDFSKKLFSKIIEKKKIVIKPNFTSPERIKKRLILKDKFFLFVGRISDEKGLDLIIQNLERFSIKIKIIGKGDLVEKINIIKSNKVELLGQLNRQDISFYMKNAECLLFPSKWYEGMPMVLLEAFCLGLPVVSTNFGNIKYIVKDGYNGLHFDIKKKFDLSYKANLIFKNKSLRKKLSINCEKEYVKKYSTIKNFLQLKNIYKKIITDNQKKKK